MGIKTYVIVHVTPSQAWVDKAYCVTLTVWTHLYYAVSNTVICWLQQTLSCVYQLISGFHFAFLQSITFISRLMHSII